MGLLDSYKGTYSSLDQAAKSLFGGSNPTYQGATYQFKHDSAPNYSSVDPSRTMASPNVPGQTMYWSNDDHAFHGGGDVTGGFTNGGTYYSPGNSTYSPKTTSQPVANSGLPMGNQALQNNLQSAYAAQQAAMQQQLNQYKQQMDTYKAQQAAAAQQQQQTAQQQWADQMKAFQDSLSNRFGDLVSQINDATKGSRDYTDTLMSNFQDLLNAQSNKEDQRWADAQTKAEQQAKQIADQQKQQYQDLIGSLGADQNQQLQLLAANQKAARQDLNNDTFKNWLAARQSAVNNGQQGSGIEQAMNTQLALSRGQELQSLYDKGQANLQNINSQFGQKLADAKKALAGVNQGQIEADQFDKLYQQGQGALNQQAQMYADLIGKYLPYSQLNPGQLLNAGLNYDQLAQSAMKNFQDNMNTQSQQNMDNKHFYDNLNQQQQQFLANMQNDQLQNALNNQFKYDNMNNQNQQNDLNRQYDYTKLGLDNKQFYDNLDQQNKQFYQQMGFNYDKLNAEQKQAFAKMSQDDQHFVAQLQQNKILDWTKIMGVDPYTGQPTLDAQKLVAQVQQNQQKLAETYRHNLLSEQISQQNASINAQKLEETKRVNDNRAASDEAKLQNTRRSTQASILGDEASKWGAAIDDIVAQMKDTKDQAVLDGLKARLKTATKNYDNATLSLTTLADGYSANGG